MRKTGMRAPRGSNWPSGRLNEPPRPAVVMIRRA
jgi:secreted PhoX family phosphatase